MQKYPIFGFPGFSENVDFWNFPAVSGVWEGSQSIGNGCGLQIDGFSAHFEPYGFIFNDFHDFGHFGIDSGGLMLLPEGPSKSAKPSSRVQSPELGCKVQ